MKRLLSIFSIALVALFAVSCGNDEVSENAKPKVTFTFSEEEIGEKTIKVLVTPSDVNVNYCVEVFASADLVGKSDSDIMEECLNSDSFRPRKGEYTFSKNNLKPNTAHTVVAFTVTGTKSLARKEYTTKETTAPLDGEYFEVKIEISEVTATSAMATTTPNGVNRYYFRIIPRIELTAWVKDKINDDYEVIKYLLENPNSNYHVYTGKKTQSCRINPETEYIAIAFNAENYEAVLNKEEDAKLFRYEFKSPKDEYDHGSLFTFDNVVETPYGFSMDVYPTRGNDAFWAYYVWTKESYDETLANEASQNIVMRSYWALYNLGGEIFVWDFGKFIRDYIGQTGPSTISQYMPLEGDTDYVVVLFYMDPEVGTDPTEIYEYYYVPVNIHTKERTLDPVELNVDVVIEKGNLKYNMLFNVTLSENAQTLRVGAQMWDSYEFSKYWDPNDWSSIAAFFRISSQTVDDETLAEAKTTNGTTISIPADKGDYVVFFETHNEEYTKTQFGVHVTPEMFDNAE